MEPLALDAALLDPAVGGIGAYGLAGLDASKELIDGNKLGVIASGAKQPAQNAVYFAGCFVVPPRNDLQNVERCPINYFFAGT